MLTQKHRYKFHCPIRHPSRDMWRFIGYQLDYRPSQRSQILPKIDSIYKSSVFEKKMGKVAYLRCPAKFYGFRSDKLASYLDCKDQSTESRPVSFFFKKKSYGRFRLFSDRYFGHLISPTKTTIKKAGFQFVGWCMMNIVSENHTKIRKVERGMANPPLWQWLGWPSSYCCLLFGGS